MSKTSITHVKALLLFALRLHYHVMCYRTGGTTALVFMNIEIPAVPFWLLVFRISVIYTAKRTEASGGIRLKDKTKSNSWARHKDYG